MKTNKYNKVVAGVFSYLLLLTSYLFLTSCEGGDLYNVDSPDWLSQKVDSIKNAKGNGDPDDIDGLEEDVYTIGATDFSTGWWAAFSKYYQIPEGGKWVAQFNMNINPSASNTYKNFALIITNDEDRGAGNYKEYGAIRYDHQPSGNSEWGDYIDRSLVESTLTFETDTDAGVDKLGGKVTLTIDRSDGGLLVKMTNGTVTKTYTQKTPLVNLNADTSNKTIRAFLVPEGSYISFLGSTVEPIGGFTSKEDKLPLTMTLNSVPRKVLQGTSLEDAFANVTATIEFEQAVTKTVTAADLTFRAVPNMEQLGTKTLVAVYNKTYKGENCQPIIASAQFEIVDKMYTSIGATDNSTPFWGAHSESIKIGARETFVTTFTNYSSGANNWNNFVIVLASADGTTEYAVVRADNYGWGNGYAACTATGDQGDWGTWLAAMDGAKVTTYVTNNGDGTADVKAVMKGTNGVTYTQTYTGINTVNPDDFYFHLTVDGCHLEFDEVIGEEDNSSAFWGAHSEPWKVPAGQTYTTRFRNFTNGANNWNNFVVVLCREDNTEFAVVRADNYGWGAGYDGNPNLWLSGGQSDWGAWLKAMDGAKVNVAVTNNGDGSADVQAVMLGNDGKYYTQEYKGIAIDPEDFYFRYTVDGCHLEFDTVIGADDNSTGWWGAHSDMFNVPAGKTVSTRIKNYTSGANNWNNFVVVLSREDNTEYAVVRADNYGWGASYDGNPNLVLSGGQSDWGAWLKAMDGATVTVSVTNTGSSANVKCVMLGNDGNTYYQSYEGISPIDAEDLWFRFTVDGSHLVFE